MMSNKLHSSPHLSLAPILVFLLPFTAECAQEGSAAPVSISLSPGILCPPLEPRARAPGWELTVSGAWLVAESRREGQLGGKEKTLTVKGLGLDQRLWPFPVAIFRFVF